MEVQANIADRVGVMYVAKFVDEGLSMTFSTIINTKDPLVGIQRFREALNYLFEYVLDQGYAVAQQAQVRPEGQAQRSAWQASAYCTPRRRSGMRASSSASPSTIKTTRVLIRTGVSVCRTSSRLSSWSNT
jgi:hypothetical protein